MPGSPACSPGPRLPGKRGRGWCPLPQRALACRGAGCATVSLQGRGPRCLGGDPGCRSPSERSLRFPFRIPVLCRSAWVSFPAAFGQAALVVAVRTRWPQGTGWACFLLPVPIARTELGGQSVPSGGRGAGSNTALAGGHRFLGSIPGSPSIPSRQGTAQSTPELAQPCQPRFGNSAAAFSPI